MGDGIQLDTTDISRVLTVLGGVAQDTQYKVLGLLQDSAQTVLDASQQEVPVDNGDLQASGHITPNVEDANNISFDVTYGDGNDTPKTYDYGDGKLATGYSWFVELGTTKMPAQAYLGPAFEEESQKLVDKLGSLFS